MGSGPDVGQPEELQQAPQCPVLTARAVKSWPDDIRRIRHEARQEGRVRVPQIDSEAVRRQRVGHAAPRLQRDIAFVRDPAGEYDHARCGGVSHVGGVLSQVGRG